MSMTIKQTHEAWVSSHALSQNLEILDVGLMSAAFQRHTMAQQNAQNELYKVELDFTPKDASILEGVLRAAVLFTFRITQDVASTPEPLPVMTLECVFEARYNVRPGYIADSPQIQAFHAGNVVFNCWPYFREFVTNATTRLELPAPPIPLLIVHVIPPAGAKGASAAASEMEDQSKIVKRRRLPKAVSPAKRLKTHN
jgi:hypothetical protein